MLKLVVATIGALALASPLAHAQRLGLIEEGEPFPDLVLPSMDDGSPMSIADFRGKRVMLHVFASW